MKSSGAVHRFLVRSALASVLFIVGVSYIPYLWCSRHGDAWYEGKHRLHKAFGEGVARWVERGLERQSFHTGSSQFNGEWLFGTYMMAAMGHGQTALQQPDLSERHIALMEQCIERMLSPEVRAFDREMWGNDPIDTLDQPHEHHAAFLGYFNLVLSLHRLLVPESRFSELNDRITESLVRRISDSRIRLIQSYPFEVYPIDNCAVIGSIGLHARATGVDRHAFIEKWTAYCRSQYVDADKGLLIQVIDCRNGQPVDFPRASGTALGLYMISYADYGFSRELYAALRKHQAKAVCGFGGVKEYPAGVKGEHGDIDSGPVIFGFGLSSTGFMLGGARLHEDPGYFKRLYATAHA